MLHCALQDIGGKLPEKGCKIGINGQEGGGGFFRLYYIAEASLELGMVRLELEAMDE